MCVNGKMRTAGRGLLCPGLAAVIQVARQSKTARLTTGEAYDAYKAFCQKAGMRGLTLRAFLDLLTELDMYSFLRTRMLYRGRHGRLREILLELPEELIDKIHETILLNFELR